MRFRVDKKLSLKQMETHFLTHARGYCDEVIASGCMSTASLNIQRVMMQYHEAWLEKTKAAEITVLPGQTKMFDSEEVSVFESVFDEAHEIVQGDLDQTRRIFKL